MLLKKTLDNSADTQTTDSVDNSADTEMLILVLRTLLFEGRFSIEGDLSDTNTNTTKNVAEL